MMLRGECLTLYSMEDGTWTGSREEAERVVIEIQVPLIAAKFTIRNIHILT